MRRPNDDLAGIWLFPKKDRIFFLFSRCGNIMKPVLGEARTVWGTLIFSRYRGEASKVQGL